MPTIRRLLLGTWPASAASGHVRAVTLALAVTCTAAVALAPGEAGAAAAVKPARPVVSLVDDLAPGPASSFPQDLTAMKKTLFFTAWTKGHGRQLWKSDGTNAGTVMLTHVPGGAMPAGLTVADGVLFFSARDPKHGRELWKSDGTVAGTKMVRDIVPGVAGSRPEEITYAIGQQGSSPHNRVLVYFSAHTAASGWQLWKSNGTEAGTVMITDVNPGPVGLRPYAIAPLTGTTAMFSGDDGVHGREPWVTDGTTAGTAMYEDLNPGPASSDPFEITPETYQVGILATFVVWYFAADDGTHGREFFVAYDGDPPADVYDIVPGANGSQPSPFVSVANETGLLAAFTGAGNDRELFAVQQPPFPPSSAGPQPGVATEVPGVGPGMGSDPALGPTSQIGLTPFPLPVTRTYFAGDLAGHGPGVQLWQADETISRGPGEGSTVSFSVNDVRPVDVISARATPLDLTPVGGTPVGGTNTGSSELFNAANSRHGRELWISDGWSTNTHMVRDINPGPAGSFPRDITVIGQTAYFSAFSPGQGIELWKVTVPPSPQMFLLGPQSAVKTGAKVTLTATMQPAPKAQRPTGSVTFYEDGTKIGSAPLTRHASGGPTASLTITARSGDHKIVAVYSGDGHYLPATSNTFLVTGN
jgi:ELWxxDGT repeat protein